MATTKQSAAEVLIVIDLAVEGDPDRTVLVGQRGDRPRVQVDDGQAPLAETDEGPRVDAFGVRSPVHDRVAHPPHERPLDFGPAEVDLPADAAHQRRAVRAGPSMPASVA